MAVNVAEPLRQARQVALVDPLALIRPVEPDGRPAQRKAPRRAGHPDGQRHPLPPDQQRHSLPQGPRHRPRVPDIVRMGGACFENASAGRN